MEQNAPAAARRIQPRDETLAAERLGTVRRLYFYLVALISATTALFALDNLLAAMADAWWAGPALAVISGPGFVRRAIAANAGLLVVATPIFLLHWAAIQGRINDTGEREAALRKFYLYASSAVALGFFLVRANNLLGGAAQLALGLPPARSDLLPAAWVHYAAVIAASGLLLWYWQGVARRDGDYGLETGVAVFWRRLYLAGVAVAGLALVVFGSAALFSALIQAALDYFAPAITWDWFPVRAGDGLARLLIGLLTAHVAWQAWRAVAARRPAALGPEDESALLRLFLYVAVVGGAVATLVPAALVLRAGLLWAFDGFDEPFSTLISSMAVPLGYIPAGIVIWYLYARRVRRLEALYDADAEAATDAVATVRRIYFYAVAATGLVLVWLGAVALVQVVLDQLLTADQLKQSLIWQQPLATGLSLLVVGLPVWLLHWRAVQAVARADTPAGAAERGSLPRRIYLYGVAFAGAILIVYYLAQVIYRLFLYALGDTSVALFSPELAEDLARSAIAALLWGVHLVALRADGHRGDAAPDDHERRRARLEARIASLERDLADARAELDALP